MEVVTEEQICVNELSCWMRLGRLIVTADADNAEGYLTSIALMPGVKSSMASIVFSRCDAVAGCALKR